MTANTEQSNQLYIAVHTFFTADEDGRQLMINDGDRLPERIARRFPTYFVSEHADASRSREREQPPGSTDCVGWARRKGVTAEVRHRP